MERTEPANNSRCDYIRKKYILGEFIRKQRSVLLCARPCSEGQQG